MSKYCINCGEPIKETTNFCPNCGKQLTDSLNETSTTSVETMSKSKKTIIIGTVIAVVVLLIGICIGADNWDDFKYATIFGGLSWKYDSPSLAEWAEGNGNKALTGICLIISAVVTELVTLVLFCSSKNAENIKQAIKEGRMDNNLKG